MYRLTILVVYRRALIENHHDVAAKHLLNVHGFLWPKEDFAAIRRRSEGDAILGDFAPVRQREHLEAAGIGKDGLVPARKPVQPAVRFNHIQTGAQEQMEGVAQNDLRAQVFDLRRQHAFDRTIGSHRHERRSFDHATRESDAAATGGAIGFQKFEGHAAHVEASCGHSNIASP